MATHSMDMCESWFSFVKVGVYATELRIHNDKEIIINTGDTIILSSNDEKLAKKVKEVKVFSTFVEALACKPKQTFLEHKSKFALIHLCAHDLPTGELIHRISLIYM